MAENADTRRFCAQCGTPLPLPCSACGFENEPTAKFCGGCGKPVGEAGTPAPAAAPPRTDRAERRQLTVMFCDLVGSTALSSRLDPEDLREVIGAYHKCVAETIGRFDGFVAKYMGDGVLVYFGYPRAHEDDAERAVRGGLAAIEAVRRLSAPEPLQVRIGLATGLAVVGDLIGSGAAHEQAVIGETPNLAARLQALAGPGEIVIPENTRRLIGSLFEYQSLGEVEIKGLAAPVPALRVLRESRLGSRFEALRTGETPLIGRDEELELLYRRWTQAKAGSGQVVLISAEPGVGKSRLAEAFRQSLETEPHTRLRYFCSPHHQDSALFPFIGQLERAAGFERDDTTAVRLEKLKALVAANTPEDGDVQLLAEMLSVPLDGRYPALELTPQRRKEKTFEALLRQLGSLSTRQPVLMIFEDLHWADPSSRELLDVAIEQIERMPVLLIATFRPEFQPSWIGQPHVTALSLRRLGRAESGEIVRGVIGAAAALSTEVVDEIIERSDGVPLFIEELTKAVRETTVSGVDGTVIMSSVPQPSLAVPATLHASLMARLDRLGPTTKEMAQIGAAIGREFSYELLAAVAERTEAELRDALDRLAAAGLILQRGPLPQATFLFKHTLVQDAAYGTSLRGRRRLLHGRIADALSNAGDQTTPEIIAHHMQHAGRSVEAIDHWREAGEMAVRCAGNREAIRHFRRGLSLLEAQPETVERWRTELAILSQLGPALMSVHGWGAIEAGEVVERAAEIGRRLASSADHAPAIANLCLVNLVRGRLDRAAEIAVDLSRIAQELGDPEVMLQAHHCSWFTNWDLGRFAEAREHTKAGAALYDEVRHAHHRRVYLGHDPGVCMLNFSACLETVLGYAVRGYRLAEESVVLARRLGHVPSLANALWHVCEPAVFRGDPASVILNAQELLSFTDAHGLSMHRAHAEILLGWGLSHLGEVTEGIARLKEGQEMLARWGSRDDLSFYLGLIADSLLAAGRYREGLDEVSRAIEVVAETSARWYEAPLYRLQALLLLHTESESDAVETSLKQAIAVAQQQGAKLWELGAATSLARLWGEQGRRSEARDLLAPVYDWFTEGFDMPDLNEAKALLDELG
jgi:class 3 adenylate cyclase/predicted ATPase